VGRLDYTTVVDRLVVKWKAYNLPLLVLTNSAGADLPSTPPSAEISLPTPVYEALRQFLSEHSDARIRPRDKAQRMFDTLLSDATDQSAAIAPVVSQWLRVTRWFVSCAHFPRSSSPASAQADELERNFELFETTLMALVRAFFSTTGELDAILEEANS
jgi:hypothetical protein